MGSKFVDLLLLRNKMLHFLIGCVKHLNISQIRLQKASVETYMMNSFYCG